MNLRPRRSEPPRVDITPLIDVVFLMLIFFMVSTTFDKQTQLKVELPSATTTDASEKPVEKIEITIDAKGIDGTDPMIAEFRSFLCGDRLGDVPASAGSPPLVEDVRRRAGKHRFDISDSVLPVMNWLSMVGRSAKKRLA